MKRSLLKIIAVLASSTILYSCGEKKQPPNPASQPVPVNLYAVQAESVVYYDNYPGTVTAVMQVDIRPEVEGYVTGIFFKEGDHVKKGQKLYTIDDSKYMASVNQAEASVKVADANQDQAQKDANRYIYLNEHDAVAKQILDHAITTLQNAKNQVSSAKQDLAKAKTDLSYSTIRAPFDGTIGISQVRLGNTVTVGQTVLNTISTDGPIDVDFVVNEKQIPRFLKLKEHMPAAKDSIFTVLLPDNTLYNYVGQIAVIDRGVNAQTGSITVRLNFPNPSSELRAGMSAIVRVRNTDTTKKMIIPGKAIVEQMGEYFVYIAKDTVMNSPQGTASKGDDKGDKKESKKDEQKDEKATQAAGPTLHALQRKVIQGQVVGNRVIIKAGLNVGDSVIVDGVQKLHDGSVITPGNPAAPKTAGH